MHDEQPWEMILGVFMMCFSVALTAFIIGLSPASSNVFNAVMAGTAGLSYGVYKAFPWI